MYLVRQAGLNVCFLAWTICLLTYLYMSALVYLQTYAVIRHRSNRIKNSRSLDIIRMTNYLVSMIDDKLDGVGPADNRPSIK